MKNSFLILLIMLIGCSSNRGPSPEDIAVKYEKAMYAYDWQAMSELLHPESLREYKTMVIEAFRRVDSASAAEGKPLIPSDSLVEAVANPEIQKLSPKEFFSTIMNVALPTWAMQQSAVRLRPTIVPLGHVAEGADSAHVVMRIYVTKEGIPINDVMIFSLKREHDEWKMLLPAVTFNEMKLRLARVFRM